MKDLNASKAALRAGYGEGTAPSVGCQLLSKPEVAEYIEQLQKETSKPERCY